MIDLAKLNAAEASEATFDLELRHPVTEEPTGLFISLVGLHSAEVRRVKDAQVNDILRRNFEAQRKAKDAKAPTVEEGQKRTSKLLASATVGWFTKEPGKRGEPDKVTQGLPFDGTRIEFSKAEAERIYDHPGFEWLRAQVDEAVGDLANFMAD